MSTHKRSTKRKRLYLNTEIQRRILFGFSAVPLVSLLTLFSLVTYYCTRLAGDAMEADVDLPSISPLFISLSVFVLVSGVTTIYQALKHSHRIAGPLERMTKDLLEIQRGNSEVRLKLREGDYLQDLADQINRALDCVAAGSPAADEEREPADPSDSTLEAAPSSQQ